MIRTSALLVAALLSGCLFDGHVGEAYDDDDDGSVATMRFLLGADDLELEGDHLVVTTELDHSRDAVARLSPDGRIEVIAELDGIEIEADETTWYVSRRGPGLGISIVAIDKLTRAQRVLAPGVCASSGTEMILDGSWIYVGCSEIGGEGERVLRISKDGTTEQVLTGNFEVITGIALDDQYVYVALDGVESPGAILTVPKVGGAVTELVGGLARPYGLLVVGDWLYVTEMADQGLDGRVSRVPHLTAPAPGPLVVLASGLGVPFFLAASDTHVYWSAHLVGLQRVPLAGGTTETLASCAGDQVPSQGCSRFVLDSDTATFGGRLRGGGGAALFSLNLEQVP